MRNGVKQPSQRKEQQQMNPMITNLDNELDRGVVYSEAEKDRAARPRPAAVGGRLRRTFSSACPRGAVPSGKNHQRAASLERGLRVWQRVPRGLRVDLPGGITHLLISGTASVGPHGETLYPGDFRAQCWRTYHNITKLLESEGATWHDVVRTTCYIRDIERDYTEFNNIRNELFRALGLDPFPASTGIQARICRSDLLIEIEALAIIVK